MNKKQLVFVFCVIFSMFQVFSFEWPQTDFQCSSFFASDREGSFNPGVVFANSGEVSLAEDGEIIMTLESSSDMGWFDSPLGNSIIVSHSNDLVSVYSNLESVKDIGFYQNLRAGYVIGKSGSSAWQLPTGEKGMIFQVMDKKIKTLINPTILMQEKPITKPLPIKGLVVVDRRGKKYDVYNGALLPAGSYVLYMAKPKLGMIHESSVTLNGEIKESVSYDSVGQVNGELILAGGKKYSFDDIYPTDGTMRLGEIILNRGTNTLEVSLHNVGTAQSYLRCRFTVQ